VGVRIPAEEQGLKKQQAGGPHPRASAKPGQNVFPDQGLNLKEEECTRENRERKGYHGIREEWRESVETGPDGSIAPSMTDDIGIRCNAA
jgi:hypothetical protein